MKGIIKYIRGTTVIFISFLMPLTSWAAGTDTSGSKRDTSSNRDFSHRVYNTVRLKNAVPRIDGKLDDPCWNEGGWAGNFRQQDPVEGAEPSQKTEMKILYDDQNIYVAIRAYDTQPDKIDRQPPRRDDFSGDIVGVSFDSYHDKQTAFEFNLTASGGKIDLISFNDGMDLNWNAVWEGKTATEKDAWTAEMKIPLSQLRYNNEKEQVWGLHCWRWIGRLQEEDQWNLIPRDGPGHVLSFGELTGIKNLPKSRRIELMPYALGKFNSYKPDHDNPYADGKDFGGSIGLDGKIGITTDFTLDFTINPDFGQVEADPSNLNLSAYETYFSEKRPFFLEGRNITSFSTAGQNFFYSRRIGRHPGYTPSEDEADYTKMPEAGTILGAVKLTGKNKKGLSVGIVESLTSREFANITKDGDHGLMEVEPLTNYFVSRLEKSYNDANTVIGGIVTSVNRSIDRDYLNFMPVSAQTAGLDFRHYLKNKTYYIDMETGMSNVSGSREAILDLQTSSARYFQRPDAGYLEIDSSLTRLTGSVGEVTLGKSSRGPWRFSEQFRWSSPRFEANDIGYMRITDRMTNSTGVSYLQQEPVNIFNSFSVHLNQSNYWNFGGQHLSSEIGGYFSAKFRNNWGVFLNLYREPEHVSTTLLRGGESVKMAGDWYSGISAHTNYSRMLSFSIGSHYAVSDDGISSSWHYSPGIHLRVGENLSLNTNMSYGDNISDLMYVDKIEKGNQNRYLFARIDQETLSLTLRADYGITPELTIQYYGSPYISTGRYSNFKTVHKNLAENYQDRFHTYTGDEVNYDNENNTWNFTDNRNDFGSFSIDNPDFNFRQFKSNLVTRWEYRPGSVFYFVWSHARTENENSTPLSLTDNITELLGIYPNDIFLVKFNYWFSL